MTFAQAYFLLAAILAIPGAVLLHPAGQRALKAFPRSKPAACVFFGAAAAWFLYGISQMGEADLAGIPRPYMLGAFGAAAVGAFFLLPDLLAVRGLAGLLLLSMRPALDAGVGKLPHSLVLATVAYLIIFAALCFGTAPYLLREWIAKAVVSAGRARAVGLVFLSVSAVCLACGLMNNA
jgi:hypothetical protein